MIASKNDSPPPLQANLIEQIAPDTVNVIDF